MSASAANTSATGNGGGVEALRRGGDLGGVDVRHDQMRAGAVQAFAQRHADVAETLDGDSRTTQAGEAEALGDDGHAGEHALGRLRPWIAADAAPADAGDVARRLGHAPQVRHAHADVFRGYVLAVEFLDPAPELHGLGIADGRWPAVLERRHDHALAAAEGEAGHGVLERHPARQRKAVGDGVLLGRIDPAPHAAEGWAEGDVVNRDHRPQAGIGIVAHDDAVEIFAMHGGSPLFCERWGQRMNWRGTLFALHRDFFANVLNLCGKLG